MKALQESAPTILKIDVNERVRLHCHFFVSEEIELDLDPKEIANEEDFIKLLGFLEWLGRSVSKELIITNEGAENEVLFCVGSSA